MSKSRITLSGRLASFGAAIVAIVATVSSTAGISGEETSTVRAVEERPCELSPESRVLAQSALDEWAFAESELLDLPEEPLAHVVLFDRRCEWHLNGGERAPDDAASHSSLLTHRGGPLPVHARPHDGEIALPDGQTIAPRGVAFAALDRETGSPFFVLALPDVWREDPKAGGEPALVEILRGVISHEIVHTRQLEDVARRVETLGEAHELPSKIHDDMIEERFASNERFAARWREETDLLFRAIGEKDAETRASLVCTSIEMARARQREFYGDELTALSALEEIFLNMEGVAIWTAYRLTKRRSGGGGMKAFEREGNGWSQDHGFALTMIVDTLVPDWRAKILSEEVASPLALLEKGPCAEERGTEIEGGVNAPE